MRVTLVHNPAAGAGSLTRDELLACFRAAGHECVYQSSKGDDFATALDDPGDLVCVAGGDGTVGKVARRMAGRNVPLALIPLGNSNNIAASLGVHGTVQGIVDGLRSAERRLMNLGMVRTQWGVSRFVESAGVGLLATMLRDAARRSGRKSRSQVDDATLVKRRVNRLKQLLAKEGARRMRVEVDGIDMSGAYLCVVATNTRYIGPHLELAPAAEVGDGMLDLLLITEEDRPAFRKYLSQSATGATAICPIASLKAAHIRLQWNAESGHVDDELWPDEEAAPDEQGEDNPEQAMGDITVTDRPLTVLVGAARGASPGEKPQVL